MDYREKSEIRDGMRSMGHADHDGRWPGVALRHLSADRRRQISGHHDVWPYGKWLHFDDLYTDQWRRMCADHPDVPTGCDQQVSVLGSGGSREMGARRLRLHPGRQPRRGSLARRHRHLVVARGTGPGAVRRLGRVQPWSNGKIASNGISYYAENQWQTAALQPKHLSAICIWEGAADSTATWRTTAASSAAVSCRTGRIAQSIPSERTRHPRLQEPHERRLGVRPETLPEEQFGQNRRDFYEDCISRKLDTDPYGSRACPIGAR